MALGWPRRWPQIEVLLANPVPHRISPTLERMLLTIPLQEIAAIGFQRARRTTLWGSKPCVVHSSPSEHAYSAQSRTRKSKKERIE